MNRPIFRMSILVLAMLAGAVTLRLVMPWNRPEVVVRERGPCPEWAARLPVPRDYVASPVVYEEERTAGPSRIISVAPSITEIVCALGLRSHLVGRSTFCRYPPGLDAVTDIGGLIDPNFEMIRSLSPDAVFVTANSGQLIAGLHQLGIPYEAVPHDTLDEVYEAIHQVGRVCDRMQTAGALVSAIRADVEALGQAVAGSGVKGLRVLISLGPLPDEPRSVFVAGPGSFLDGLLSLSGHQNAAIGYLRKSHGELSLASLVMMNPQAIVEFREHCADDDQLQAIYQNWSMAGRIEAIEQQRLRRVGGPDGLSAGPRIARELHQFIVALSEFSGSQAAPQ